MDDQYGTLSNETGGDDALRGHLAQRAVPAIKPIPEKTMSTPASPTKQPAVKPFTLSRTFEAPRDVVWKAWTERERLLQWFGPKGFAMTTAKLDLRPGGNFHYCLRSPDGKEMWGQFVYREISAPGRIVLVNSFSDEKSGLTRHPFSATWPLEMLSTTTLTEKDGKTKLTIEWSPLNPTDGERKTFDTSHDGMKQGWTGTFDQLAAYLAKA